MICEHCGKEHDGTFGSGRFCSIACANSRCIHRDKINEKIKLGVLKHYDEKEKFTYICEDCGNEFKRLTAFREGRHIRCNKCIQNRSHVNKDPKSILDLSKRTISKILHRANKGCSICGWNESTCDIHHIIQKKDGGNDNIENLIVVCPNCHRIIHSLKKYSIDFLKENSIDKDFPDWKNYYHPSN